MAEASRGIGISRAAAFRLLHTLSVQGYVLKNSRSPRYYPAARLIALGQSLTSSTAIAGLMKSAMATLFELYGETVNVGLPHGDRVLYIDMLESRRGLRMAAQIGERDHLHSTALGKALLAALSHEDAAALIAGIPLPRLTHSTITSRTALFAEIARIRERGYAVDDEENEMGARCVGVAIRDAGRPVVALSVSGPSVRMPEALIADIGRKLVATRDGLEAADHAWTNA